MTHDKSPEANLPTKKPELFTVQVQGKGVRLKARVPGWVAAIVFRYAKENEEVR